MYRSPWKSAIHVLNHKLVHSRILGGSNNVREAGSTEPDLGGGGKKGLKEWNAPRELFLDRSVWKTAIHVPKL